MGHYASFPVRDQAGKILGVAVIKRTQAEIATLIHEHYVGLVIDPRGIVVMSNRAGMILKSLWPLSEKAKGEVIASRQFGDGPFTPILDQEPVDGGRYLLRGKTMMALRRPAPWEDWSIVVFGSVWPISQARLLGISITLFLNLALISFFTVIVIMREGEERFRHLFENAADSFILHDRDRVMEVNQQTCHSLGYTREELLRMSPSDIEVGHSQDRFLGPGETEGGAFTFSGIYRRKDGSTFPTEVRVGEVPLRGQTLNLAAVRDITKRRQAEEALQAERQRLFRLLDGLQAYIYLRRPDYSLVYVNQYFRERFGDPASLPCFAILHNRHKPCEGCPSEKVFETGTPQESEWTSSSGRTYHIYDYPFADVDGTPLVLEMGMDITQHKQAEEGLRTSEEALRQSQGRYRMLAGHLLTAQEAERKRLARELHDDLSQRLAALAMEAETLERETPLLSGADHVRLKEMKDKLVELSIDVHAMSRRLHPSILDDLGLADAVASECAMFRKRDGIVVNYRVENIRREVPPNVAVCLYRIVQEALRNISRHAGATEVAISLVGEKQAIRLSIRDNGKGFDPGQKTSQVGLGLDSMKERAYLIGGDFSAKSQPGQGTVIEVLAPLSRRVV
jgi:PAS domain S-box-containing protein